MRKFIMSTARNYIDADIRRFPEVMPLMLGWVTHLKIWCVQHSVMTERQLPTINLHMFKIALPHVGQRRIS